MVLKDVIEALVFASQKPLSPKEIVAALRSAADDSDDELVGALAKTKEPAVSALLEELKIEYIQATRPFQLVEQVSGWAVATRPEYALWVRQLYPESKPARLSGPALETLAIIAYRQPITRADIEAVRGVAVDGVMQSLLDRSLVRISGRANVPGRPLLYETTQVFMEHFGLRTLDELPNCDELRRVRLPTAAKAAAEVSAPVAPEPAVQPEPTQIPSEATEAQADPAQPQLAVPADLAAEETPAGPVETADDAASGVGEQESPANPAEAPGDTTSE